MCKEKGIALVLVLWVIVLLSTMAMGMMATQRSELKVVSNLVERSRLYALAEAGINYGIGQAIGYRVGGDIGWKPDGRPHDWSFAGSSVRIHVADEMSRISLNNVTEPMLDRLLEYSGVQENRDAIRDAILDWRDEDDAHRLSGAEDPQYAAEGLEYGARDGEFATVAELRQVLGVDAELYRKLAGVFTVHTRSAKVHAETASSAVLHALPGMTPEMVAAYIAMRDEQYAQGLDAPPLAGVPASSLGRGNSGTFRISASVKGANETTVALEAVVRRGGSMGYTVLEWMTATRPAKTKTDIESKEQ